MVFIHAGIEGSIEVRDDLAHAGVGARFQFPARFEQFNNVTEFMMFGGDSNGVNGVEGSANAAHITTPVLEPTISISERKQSRDLPAIAN